MNKCYWSAGSEHSCCTHPHYCIFNNNRWDLDKQLTKLWKRYNSLLKLKNSYNLGYFTDSDYSSIISKLTVVKNDIGRLTEFKKNVLAGEVNGYGYGKVESKRV